MSHSRVKGHINKIAWILLTVSLAWGCIAFAEDAPAPAGSSLRFRHLGIEDGLAQSSVQAILQDRAGYMWFGTQDGLQRYDGYEFLTLRHDPGDPASLADNIVNALAMDDAGTIWVATENGGVDRLDPGTRHFTHFRNDPHDPASLASDSASAIYLDREHRLWVGTDAGLDLFDGKHGFRHFPVPAKLPNGGHVYSLYEDKVGRLWVGTAHGVYYLDSGKSKLLAFVPDGAMNDNEHGVFTDSPIHAFGEMGDALWVASGRGIVVLDAKRMARQFYTRSHSPDTLSNEHVLTLLLDAAGEMWVGTYGGGIDRFEASTGHFSSYQHDATDPGSLVSDNIDVLYQDRSGLIWIGTDDGGIDIYNPRTRAFGYYRHKQGNANSLSGNLVWSIYKDTAGKIWVGTDHGLTRLDASRRIYRQYHMGQRPPSSVDDDQVNVVYGDRHGNIWVGTDYGLYRYLPASDTFQRYELIGKHDNPNGDVVSNLYQDSKDRFWVATGGGLVQFDTVHGKLHRFQHDPSRNDSLPDDSVSCICETLDQRIWTGTAGGLGSFDGVADHFTVYRSDPRDADSLSFNNVQACLDDGRGGLWVGTADGLDHLEGGRFKRYFTSDGLPNDTIYAVLADRDGGIWVSTDNGLSRLDPDSGSFHNYLAGDGLQSDEFNGGAGYAAPDGELFFGGVNGMNAFYPRRLSHQAPAPAVAITRFLRQGTEVPLISTSGPVQGVEVQYRQNTLNFEFTAFDYAKPELNQFSYRMDGFDTDWHTLRGTHTVTYTNLDPGKYLLRVRGANSDGVWSEREASLGIEVQPPAWRSGWALLFYVAAGFVLVMIAMGIYKRFITREHQLEHEQQRRQWAEALHNLIHSVTAQRDERGIGEQLIDTLTNFITYERALFYIERDGALRLVASRGIGPSEQEYLEHWPGHHPKLVAQLKQAPRAQLLSTDDAATLAGNTRAARQHYLAVPLRSGNGAFRLLLVGRPNKPLDAQQVEVAAAMAKQVSVALDNAKLIEDLENLATTDGLTRLYNRRHFMELAEGEFVRSRRYLRDLSLLLIDADHFKAINDAHGHDVGDRTLRLLADTCRQGLRQLDVVGRYGGEELVVLLPEASAAMAQETAERLRRSVESLRIPASGGDVRLTVSIGVATVGPDTESVAALVNAADRALYAAKRAGRNRVMATGQAVTAD
ncbi:MAG TPA: two-component regulator propeller domain-containing protein [Gammaproteobacteria bacterium]|nr:two-component regulator propeller domain-containing protein [Gammaproteobacteria bacterium]